MQLNVENAKMNIVSVIERYGIDLIQRGDEYRCVCPFHEDSNPSMSVSPTKNLFHCFGCGASGDAIDFVKRHDSLDFKTAVTSINDLNIAKVYTKKIKDTNTCTPYSIVPENIAPAPTIIKRKIQDKWVEVSASYIWQYRDINGNHIGNICRFDLPHGKEILPQSFCKDECGNMGWKWIGFLKPRPLFGLELLNLYPNAKILLVEGEKSCTSARIILKDALVSEQDVIAMSWPGGAQAVKYVDWSVLNNRNIMLWPDADKPGTNAMLEISKLLPKSNTYRIIDVPNGVPEGWDLADALPDGFNIIDHLKETNQPVSDKPIKASTQDNQHFTILGYDNNEYYIFQHERGKIDRLKKSDFTSNGLISIAPSEWWLAGFGNGKGRIDTDLAFDWVARSAAVKGIYDPSRTRGRGAWLDGKRIVFHHGAFLTVDGEKTDVTDMTGPYVYEKYKSFPPIGDTSMSDDEGAAILEISEMFRWSNPASAVLLAGWIALSPICGALRWRPHVWLHGSAGSGKTTLLNDFIHHLLSGIAVYAQGNSTEAGLRQRMLGDAVPVLFDESESNTEKDSLRIQNILSLIRQSSSLSDGETMKGTASGTAMAFHIQSMFCLSSIQTALIQQADKERVTVLNLRPRLVGNDAASAWSDLSKKLYNFRSIPNLPKKFMHRLISYLPNVLKNVHTFIEAAAEKFGIQREGDQYGTLFAGAYFLTSTALVTKVDARKYIDKFEFEEYRENSNSDEASRALLSVMSGVARSGSSGFAVHSLLQVASGKHVEGTTLRAKEAVNILANYGMKIVNEDLVFCNNHPKLASLVYGTPFAGDLRSVLLRYPGSKKVEKTIRFGGVPSRGFSIPLEDILKDDE